MASLHQRPTLIQIMQHLELSLKPKAKRSYLDIAEDIAFNRHGGNARSAEAHELIKSGKHKMHEEILKFV